MFGVPANPEIVFNVYHDESGTYAPGAGDRWLLHGMLFVRETKQDEVFTALQNARQEAEYHEEVHYVKLCQSVAGPKARCAKSWLRTYVGRFSEFFFYHCLLLIRIRQAFNTTGSVNHITPTITLHESPLLVESPGL
jgi:hypothetical protein